LIELIGDIQEFKMLVPQAGFRMKLKRFVKETDAAEGKFVSLMLNLASQQH
jgi:hypothetical protein